ncbi:putative recombination initiation defects 3 [Vigna angularis]|uniref:putative recombination initiation defects 3 n=1 Tax=Phaseolus angularis TaxID=3914 RepID=UPI0022B50378|nr:putative recombination initiation defects 3 [Vigna angularis]
MKINKACDLSSISVFPPPLLHSRKANNVSSGLQVSHSQHRTQPSQQSFSQGLSSQHGLLSHFSQNSLDEAVTTNEPRVGSQEQENSLRRLSSLPRPTYSREESHPLNSRSSSNLMLKWNSADHKGQLSEGLEHRIGIMETSLSRFAMILDSVQSDVMQVNKGTKEIILEVECIRQKLIAQDNSFQLMTKGQEEFKAMIDGNLKSLSEQMSHVSKKEKLQDVYLAVSPLPRLIEASMQSVKNDLCNITKEMQARTIWQFIMINTCRRIKLLNSLALFLFLLVYGISSNLKSFNQKNMAPPSLSLKNLSKQVITPKKRQPLAKEANTSLQAAVAPEVEMGGWKSVKKERVTFSDKASEKVQKKKEPQTEKFMKGGIDCAIVIESDEETEVGFSCLVKENAGRSGEDLFGKLTKEEEEETERILRKARRRKRKSIVIL